MKFLELEGAYIIIAVFIFLIGAVVTTRPFMSKNAFKKGMPILFGVLASLILLHYYVTTSRMGDVKTAFYDNKTVICESRENRKGAQSILISKEKGWRLEEDVFFNDQYTRGFHSARCLVHDESINLI